MTAKETPVDDNEFVRPEGYTDAQPPKLPGAPEPAPADPKK